MDFLDPFQAPGANTPNPPVTPENVSQTPSKANVELQVTPAVIQPEANMHDAQISNFPSYIQPQQQETYHSPYGTGPSTSTTSNFNIPTGYSKETSEVIARIKANGVSNLTHGSTEWEAAKAALRTEMDLQNTNGVPTAANPNAARTGGRRGRGPRRREPSPAHGTIILNTSSGSGAPYIFSTPSTPATSRGRGRGGRPRGSRASRGVGRGTLRGSGKRKRPRGSEDDGNETSSSEEITALPSQSRSGRKIFQASTSTPIIKIDPDEPQESPLALAVPAPVSSASKAAGKKKVVKRTPGASAVCKNCGRGHSPASNAIVFCDGCNTPWHQYCHDPPIKKDYLIYVDKDWFCADCVLLREEKGKLQGKVAGDGMSLVEKRKYLQGLSHSTLVSLLLQASSLHPSLPIYPPKVTYIIPATPSTPLNATSSSSKNSSSAKVVAVPVEEEEYYSDDELPYPKAGNGIQLPPESENPDILVDDDTEAFSHRWEGVAEMLAEVARLNLGSPGRVGLGVRTGNAGFGIRAGA